MKRRSVLAPLLLPFVTLGIYSLVWLVKTKNEMNRLGATVPTALWMLVPLAYFWWLWRYCKAVEQVTVSRLGHWTAYLLCFFVPLVGHAIIQDAFNNLPPQAAAAGA